MPRRPTAKPPTAERLLALRAFRGRTVAVVGDLIADEFIYGQIERVSREAPVLILKYDATEIVPGGAGNAANNVAALGGARGAAGVVGRDERRRRAGGEPSARRGAATRIVRARGYVTPVKTRILAGGVHSAKQQVVRIDRDPVGRGPTRRRRARSTRQLARAIDERRRGHPLRLRLRPRHARARRTLRRGWRALARSAGVPILVDSRYALLRYHGVTACTPNESEVEQLLGVAHRRSRGVLERAGRDAAAADGDGGRAHHARQPRHGALRARQRRPMHIPIVGSDEIADVTGAGDTVIATFDAGAGGGRDRSTKPRDSPTTPAASSS